MTMTPEKAREMLAEMAEYQRIIAKCPTSKDFAKHCRVRAEVFECVLAHLAELEAQLADMRRDLSDARSGWESAVAEVQELRAAQTAGGVEG